MKTRYIIFSLSALMLAATACQKEDDHYIDAFRVSSSYVTIPATGGSVEITVDDKEAWTLDYDIPTDTTYTDAKKGKVTESIMKNQLAVYDWVKVSPASGTAGTTKVTFSAEATDLTHNATLQVKVGDKLQNIIVQLGVDEVSEVKVADVNAGPDGKTFRVKGTCTSISNTNYGNWYLTDDNGDRLYIYGTVDATGKYNWSSFDIAVGDIVTVQGPKTTYGTTVELVDVTVVKVQKALLASDDTYTVIAKDAGTFEIALDQKGEGLYFESKSDWLSLDKGYEIVGGKYVFKVTPEANATGARRTGSLLFKSTKGKESTELPVTVVQLDETATGTVSDIREAIAPGTSSSRINFDYTIGEATVTYVNGSNIFLEDAKGALLIYSNAIKLAVGQTVSGRVFGTGYAYNNLPEATVFDMVVATVTAAPTDSRQLPKPTEVTLAELLANWDSYFCRLVTIKGLSVTDALAATYEVTDAEGKKTSGDRSGKVSDGTNEIAVYAQNKAWLQMEEGKKYDLTCIPTVNKTTKQLGVWQASHIVEVQ